MGSYSSLVRHDEGRVEIVAEVVIGIASVILNTIYQSGRDKN